VKKDTHKRHKRKGEDYYDKRGKQSGGTGTQGSEGFPCQSRNGSDGADSDYLLLELLKDHVKHSFEND
jgi:hypothetical protein